MRKEMLPGNYPFTEHKLDWGGKTQPGRQTGCMFQWNHEKQE